ncbi:MAG: ATP-binding protein [Acidobacteriota bacterium]
MRSEIFTPVTETESQGLASATMERRYHALVNALPGHAVWVANARGEMDEDSPRFRCVTGLSWEQFRGLGWMNALHPDDRATARERLISATTDPHGYEHEFRVRVAAGQYRWFAARGVPLTEANSVSGWVGTFTDIHRPKVLTEGWRFLHEANDLFASTLDEQTVLSHLVAIAVPTLADSCNVQLADNEGLMDAGPAAVDPNAEIIRDVSDEMLASYVGNAADLDALCRMGERAIMLVPMSIRGSRFGTIRLIGSSTNRYYGDEELEIACRFAHRAAIALDKARLHAQAVNAIRAKDIFLATLSHEMKTPLTAILGWTRMLRAEGPVSELFDEALDAVEQSARVQERLIEDVLDVSRVITGKMHIEKKRLDLRDVIVAAVDVVSPTADQNGVRLRIHDDPQLFVFGDATRLEQVIWNLLTNAVKFTPAGGFIEIQTSARDGEAVVTVRDSGRGIPADFLPHIFDQFHQATLADRAQHHGLGLGLAIVRHLVLAHGGSVEAHSEGEGKGAEFIVALPLYEEAEDSETMADGGD